jgi:hypothetical protein
MAETTIAEKAQASVETTLSGGQSATVDGMSQTQASLRDAHAIMVSEEQRLAGKSGRRPLFRGINLSGVE